MATKVFFMVKLRDDVEPEQYERFVREVTYPFVRRVETLPSYVVARVTGMVEGEGRPPYDFVEVGEVTDLDAYMAELTPDNPAVAAFDEQWLAHVADAVAVYGEVVEP